MGLLKSLQHFIKWGVYLADETKFFFLSTYTSKLQNKKYLKSSLCSLCTVSGSTAIPTGAVSQDEPWTFLNSSHSFCRDTLIPQGFWMGQFYISISFVECQTLLETMTSSCTWHLQISLGAPPLAALCLPVSRGNSRAALPSSGSLSTSLSSMEYGDGTNLVAAGPWVLTLKLPRWAKILTDSPTLQCPPSTSRCRAC